VGEWRDSSRVWESISANRNASATEKQHKPWFDEGCSKLLDQRKQAKLEII